MVRPATAIATVAVGLALLAHAGRARAAFALTAPPTSSFAVTLNGLDQTATFTLPLTVADTAPDPTNGWRLTIRASTLNAGGGRTLAAPSVTSVAWACQTGCSAAPVNSVALPVTLSTFLSRRFFNAANATGIGTFTVTPTISVAVPGNARTGSYTSTVTTTLTSGP